MVEETRVLDFGEGGSLGALRDVDARGTGRDTYLGEAEGMVQVPRYVRLALGSAGTYGVDWSRLDALAPDDLWEVDLEDSTVQDEDLVHIGRLHGLRFLNLSLTGVSDRGLMGLVELAMLESLNVYDSQVTVYGVSLLQVALPLCEISGVLGWPPPKSAYGAPDRPLGGQADLNVTEVAAILRVHGETVRHWIWERRFPGAHTPAGLEGPRIPQHDLDALRKQLRTRPQHET